MNDLSHVAQDGHGKHDYLRKRVSATGRRRGLIAVAGLAALAALAAACSNSGPLAQPRGGATGSSGIGSGTGTSAPASPGSSSSPSASPSVPGEHLATGERSGVAGGALFGSDAPLAHKESQLGRNMAIVRIYRKIGQTFPDAQEKHFMSTGSTLLVSLDTLPPRGPSYATIAAGKDDGVISRFLRQVDEAAVHYHLGAMYISFEHEANTPQHNGLGTPAQFVQAWDHVHQLATSAHLDWNQGGRLHWVWILAHRAFFTNRPKLGASHSASAYWPGSNEVDIVAADGYNSGGGTGHSCRLAPKTKGGHRNSSYVEQGTQVQSPESIFGPLVAFAKSHGNLPVFIAEWGTISYASGAVQPDYIRQMEAYVAANPEIAAALYWNGRPPHGPCDYAVVGHQASMAALASMGHSARMQGHII